VDVTIRYADGPRVFGALVVPQRAALVARIGEDAFRRALARLPQPVREEYLAVTEEAWCSADTPDQVLAAAALEAGIPAPELVEETVLAAIKDTVGKRWWRPLLRVTTDLALLGRTPMFYARSYDKGSLTGERIGPGRATLTLDGWPDAGALHLVAIAAGVRAVLELAGRREVRVAPRPDGALTRFDITWTP
jgi:hypothetical protein